MIVFTITFNKNFTIEKFFQYHVTHPGPKSFISFNFWLRNGGKDPEAFRWKKNTKNRKKKKLKPYEKRRAQVSFEGQVTSSDWVKAKSVIYY